MSDHAHAHDELEDHDLGLSHDLPQDPRAGAALGRRGLLGLMGGVGAVALVGCATTTRHATTQHRDRVRPRAAGRPRRRPAGGRRPGGPGGGGGESSSTSPRARSPRRPAGPYPGDGSNGSTCSPRAASCAATSPQLRLGVRRRRGRPGDRQAQGLRPQRRRGDRAARRRGLPLALRPGGQLLAVLGGRRRRELPARRAGGRRRRRPRVHDDLPRPATPAAGRTCTSRSTSRSTARPRVTNKLRTSQLAIPAGRLREVYGVAEGYDASVANLAGVSLDSDRIFSDGYSLQLATVTGSVDEGYTFTPQRAGLTRVGHWRGAVRPARR